jgi:hypothetical protein
MHTPTKLYPYDTSPTGTYLLSRDGEEVFRGSELGCFQFIHKTHSYSMSHALLYEGYSMTPVQEIVPSPTVVCDEVIATPTINIGG